jgi:hypothetical protein
MGILYGEYDNKLDDAAAAYLGRPKEEPSPMFTIRPSRRKPRRSHSQWQAIPLYLSLSDLSTDADIARLIYPSISYTETIQHRDITTNATDIPQSLPPPSALSSLTGSIHILDDINTNSIPINFDLTPGDWAFITASPHTTPVPHPATPISEPETWILLSDDS